MQVALTQGDYQARSVIAAFQRCCNLYPEKNADGAPFPFTYYPRAGLTQRIAGSNLTGRCAYRATDGSLYEVVGPSVYYTNARWQRTLLGTIPNATTPVVMSDNGLAIVLVDGAPGNGWCIDMASRQFAPVSGQAGAFYGGTRVDDIDTFLILNRPGTNQWYTSLSEVDFSNLTGTISPTMTAAAFDPLDIAAKTGNPDAIVALIAMHREVWLIGTETTEVWYDAGSADFAFGELPGVFIEHGCVAPYSIAKEDLNVFWLSQDRQGQSIVLMGNQYRALRISTHAIEQQIQQYATVSDAIGFTYQQLGHTFYVLTFPTADATWVYDLSQQLWHEETWADVNGLEHRTRLNNCANVYGVNVGQDWQTGALYQIDANNPTDNGASIIKRKGFPVLVKENVRLSHSRLILDMDVGEVTDERWTYPGAISPLWLDSAGQDVLDSSGGTIFLGYSLDSGSPAYPLPFGPSVSLHWSDNRGKGWGNPRVKELGATGKYNTIPLWTKLGMGRNRVYEAFWDGPFFTALNGAYVVIEAAET